MNPSASLRDLQASAELQDDLLAALNDLERLQGLLDDSQKALHGGFFGLHAWVERRCGADMPPELQPHVALAVKALQFQDLSTQLLTHTRDRLRHRADRVGHSAFGGDGLEESHVASPPHRPNPVTQAEMDTGFVELF